MNGATFEQAAQLHAPRVFGYLVRRCSADDAADVWQQVLMVAWLRADQLPQDPEEQVAWLIGTARRTLANLRRGQVRRSAATQRLRDQLEADTVPLAPASSGDSRQERLHEALGGLPELDRELLALVYWDGLSCEQAAHVLQIKPAACRKRMQRARARLQSRLEPALAG